MIIALNVGLIGLGVIALLILGRRGSFHSDTSTLWINAATKAGLHPGHVVPRDALDAYEKIPVGAMSRVRFKNPFELFGQDTIIVFARYDHTAPFPHPCRECIVGFARVRGDEPSMWVLGRRSLLAEPSVGGGTFHVPVDDAGASLQVRAVEDVITARGHTITRLVYQVFGRIGCPFDVVVSDGWLIVAGPRVMYDKGPEFDLSIFIRGTLELANRMRGRGKATNSPQS